MLYRIFQASFYLLFTFLFRMNVVDKHLVPDKGPVILCANHISLLDPPLLGTPLTRKVHFMAKEELFKVPVVGFLIHQFGAYPVKRGGVSKESIRKSLQLLHDQQVLGIFPEGSRSNAGGIGKKGAASLALKGNATVIPVAIVGKYAPFKSITIIYGKPVDLSEFAGESTSENLEKATEKIMSTIRTMVTNHSRN